MYRKSLSTNIEGTFLLDLYISNKSGIKIAVVKCPGPIISGHIALATKVDSDDGLPHILEHLIFMGSRKFPHKGSLDLVSSNHFGDSLNAETRVDRTTYNLSTVGSANFINVLKVLMEHILFPSLTEESFLLEIHHIDSKGIDGGVAYLEVKTDENKEESISSQTLMKSIFEANTGYCFEYGGLMENFRDSVTLEKVVEFHNSNYRTENMFIVIVGDINVGSLISHMEEFDKHIESRKLSKGTFQRPWLTDLKPMIESVELEVKFPSDDEENLGNIYFAWRGPNSINIQECLAIEVVLLDICENLEDLPCIEMHCHIQHLKEIMFTLELIGVHEKDYKNAKERFFAALNNHELNFHNIHMMLSKKKTDILVDLETNCHEYVAEKLIQNFIYGENRSDLEKAINVLEILEILLKEDHIYWITILQTYFLDNKYVKITSIPSTDLSTELQKKEKERLKRQKSNLTLEDLLKKGEKLRSAISTVKKKPQYKLLHEVTLPDIKFHPTKLYSNIDPENSCNDLKGLPMAFQLINLETKFVTIFVLMRTNSLTKEEINYLPLYLFHLDRGSIKDKDLDLDGDEVQRRLLEDVIDFKATTILTSLICLELQCKPSTYEKTVKWAGHFMKNLNFKKHEVLDSINALQNIYLESRMPSQYLQHMSDLQLYTKDSRKWITSFSAQTKSLLKMKDNPNMVIDKLSKIHVQLQNPKEILIQVGLELSSVGSPVNAWKQMFNEDILPTPMKFLSENAKFKSKVSKGYVLSLETDNISNLALCSPVEVDEKDVVPLIAAVNFFTQLQGPLWSEVRGRGLCYGIDLYFNKETRILWLEILNSSNIVEAYKVAKDTIENQLCNPNWSEDLTKSAINGLCYNLIDKYKTVYDVLKSKVTQSNTEEILEKLKKVTASDMKEKSKRYIAELFNPHASCTSITCAPRDLESVVTCFKELTVISSVDELYEIEP